MFFLCNLCNSLLYLWQRRKDRYSIHEHTTNNKMVGGVIAPSPEAVCHLNGIGYKFNEWFSFLDLDNFNSDHLIANLTLKDKNNRPFTWRNVDFIAKCNAGEIPLIALRQAESLFNLSQLMFALYHGSLHACTFLDLQKNRPPRDIRQRGFTKLDNCNLKSGTSFRQSLHGLCWNIVENGGLPVIFYMIQNPVLPIIQQKCLDALTNILCVDHIEWLVLSRQPWFLKKLITMVAGGDLQCDMVPAISVIDRLVVVILAENMTNVYEQLLKLNFIGICIDQLQSQQLTHEVSYLHFIKFQTIAMQALALLCQDHRSCNWPERLRDRMFLHAVQCTLSWDTERPPSDPKWDRSESFYRNMSFSSSSLLFSLIILIHAILKWPGKKESLQQKGLMFKYQLSKMMTLTLCNDSQPRDANAPIIRNAVQWMIMTIFSSEDKGTVKTGEIDNTLSSSITDPLSELCEKVYRTCSYKQCRKKETQVNQWRTCKNCNVVCYCSEICKQKHGEEEHDEIVCNFLSMKR